MTEHEEEVRLQAGSRGLTMVTVGVVAWHVKMPVDIWRKRGESEPLQNIRVETAQACGLTLGLLALVVLTKGLRHALDLLLALGRA